MKMTKKYINQLREKSFLNISEELEKELLAEFCDDIYTEQDLWEQVRKLVRK